MEEENQDIRKTVIRQRSSSGRMDAGLSNYVFGKVPPQARDLEEAVLGAMMLEKTAVPPVLEMLKDDVFYVEAHQHVFTAIRNLAKRIEPVDLLTVTEELRRLGTLEKVGGAFAVTDLTNRVTSAANVEYHSRIILDKYLLRELIKISTRILEDAYEDTTDVHELITNAGKDIINLSSFEKTHNVNIDARVGKAIKQIKMAKESGNIVTGVPSGIIKLDEMTGGWQKQDLITVASRPGMGKSAFIISIAKAAARAKVAPYMFSLEMSDTQIGLREIAMEMDLKYSHLRKGQVSDEDLKRITDKEAEMSEFPFYVDSTSRINTTLFRTRLMRHIQDHGVGLAILDYLQLHDGEDKRQNTVDKLTQIVQELKQTAKMFDIPLIDVSQLNRDLEKRPLKDRRPQLADLKGSGGIEEYSDMVIFLYRDAYYKKEMSEADPDFRKMEIDIAKHKQGALGLVNAHCIIEKNIITDWNPIVSTFSSSKDDMPF